jgi:hypothetical protein
MKSPFDLKCKRNVVNVTPRDEAQHVKEKEAINAKASHNSCSYGRIHAVQQPVQQRRRTSAKNHNTLWTVKGRFKHGKDMGDHQ